MLAMRRLGPVGLVAFLFVGNARADDPTSFRDATKALRQGIFLVGLETGGHGTAWVISKKHRLLATNAHVADIFFNAAPGKCLAMMNESHQVYTVTKAWCHPGLRRFVTADENLWVRSTNPKVGAVNADSPDIAILQLGPWGPDLPVELSLAGPKVLLDMQSLPAAILGFPGHDTFGWPPAGQKAQATFHEGVVSRVTDFSLKTAATEAEAQRLQYTMESWGGFSGSPIYVRSGEVIGLHNSGRSIDPTGRKSTRQIAQGVRADSLYELLVYHHLDAKVPVPMAADQLLIKRWSTPDPNSALYQKLKNLVDEANDLIYNRLEFQAGIDKCTQAIGLFGRYAPAYSSRCDGYNNWFFRHGSTLAAAKKKELLNKALQDATTNIQLHRTITPGAFQQRIAVYNNLGYLTKEKKFNYQAMDDVDNLLALKNLAKSQRAMALSSKAVALANLGNGEHARVMHLTALQVDPDNGTLWDNRASFFENNNNPGLAKYDYAMGALLRKSTILLNRSLRKDVKIVSSVDGRLTAQDPVDGRGCHYHVWEVELEQGYFHEITLKNPQFKSNKDYDPILRLADAKGRVLREDDDGGAYPNARIFFTPSASATYQLTVTSYIQRQTGPYLLTVRRLAKDD
jgi:tetratricopeptide (TPR) repeat protein